MRRFEYKDARSYKFWEIEITDTHYTVRYGKVGTDGQTQTKAYPTAAKVAAEAEKKIREKTSKGYAEVASAAPKKAAVTREEDWAVRADRLQSEGDPWGQRIALEMAREAAKGADKRKFTKELDELEAEHGEHFFGAELLAIKEQKGFDEAARLEWKSGYIVRARVGSPDYEYDGPEIPELLRAIVKSPAAEFLADLTVGLFGHEGDGVEGVASIIAEGGERRELVKLFLGDFSRDDQEISWVNHGELEPLWTITPKLETLRLRGAGMVLGKFVHPSLQRLEIETGGLPPESVRSLAVAELPELRHMEVWFGSTYYGATKDIADLLPIFSSKTLPKLEHLGLQNSEIADEIVVELARGSLLAQVGSLDLSMGIMREAGARALIDNASKFKHLRSINLDENYIPYELHAELSRALGKALRLGDQRTPDTYNGTEHYYTSVAE